MDAPAPALHPPSRLLCGPGPTNVSPAAMAGMWRPMLGHLDPDFHDIATEVVDMLRAVYRGRDGLVIPLQSTGTSGMEAGLANLLEPGDTAIVAASGFFGHRIADLARRLGAVVVLVEAELGQAVAPERMLAALERHPEARLLALVHAETSTGVENPLATLAAELRGHPVLLMADCVTSLGGVELDFDGWGLDYAYACTQKCLGAPPGMSPIAVSERALERIRARRTPVPFSLDLLALADYWIRRPAVYHHTVPILHVYALFEVLREVLEEGLEARWRRHQEAGDHLQSGLHSLGLELFADPAHQLAPLTAVRVPSAIDGRQVQLRMLREEGIEIGGGLGPSAPPIWRIGLMGPNADLEVADRVLDALTRVLVSEPVPVG